MIKPLNRIVLVKAPSARAKAVRDWVKAHALTVGLYTVVLTTAGLLLLLPVGAYLDTTLFTEPVQRLKAGLGLRASLAPEIRLIVVDDPSLDDLGRAPRLGEWLALMRHLHALGFSRVFYSGLLNNETWHPPEAGLPEGLELIASVADYPANGPVRTLATDDLPERVLVPADGTLPALKLSKAVLGLPEALLPLVAHVGTDNIASNNTHPVGFHPGTAGVMLPYVGFHALTGLRWQTGRLTGPAGALPLSNDGLVYTDFVTVDSVFRATTRANAFYRRGADGELRVAPRKEADARVMGGRIAVLVPEGQTGSRFIESPLDGKVPAYVGLVSLLSGILRGELLVKPFSHGLYTLAFTVLTLLVVTRRRFRVAMALTGGLAVVQVLTGAVLLIALSWLLPCAEVLIIVLVALACRAASQFYRTSIAKARVDAELSLGRKTQSLYLPEKRAGKVGAWEFRIDYQPYGPMSGDWFQVYSVEKAGVIAIGDVAGKGASAALATSAIATVWAHITSAWQGRAQGSELADGIHRAILRTFRGGQNTTLSLACLEERKLSLTSCAAPYWITFGPDRAPGTVRTPRADPLGLEPDKRAFPLTEVEATPGQIFINFTDGILEGSAAMQRLVKRLGQLDATLPLDVLAQRILAAAGDEARGAVLPDDRTLIILRYSAPAAIGSGAAGDPAAPAA